MGIRARRGGGGGLTRAAVAGRGPAYGLGGTRSRRVRRAVAWRRGYRGRAAGARGRPLALGYARRPDACAVRRSDRRRESRAAGARTPAGYRESPVVTHGRTTPRPRHVVVHRAGERMVGCVRSLRGERRTSRGTLVGPRRRCAVQELQERTIRFRRTARPSRHPCRGGKLGRGRRGAACRAARRPHAPHRSMAPEGPGGDLSLGLAGDGRRSRRARRRRRKPDRRRPAPGVHACRSGARALGLGAAHQHRRRHHGGRARLAPRTERVAAPSFRRAGAGAPREPGADAPLWGTCRLPGRDAALGCDGDGRGRRRVAGPAGTAVAGACDRGGDRGDRLAGCVDGDLLPAVVRFRCSGCRPGRRPGRR